MAATPSEITSAAAFGIGAGVLHRRTRARAAHVASALTFGAPSRRFA